jgi:hypothetical protein
MLLAVLSLVSAASAADDARSPTFSFTGDDDAVAATQLAAFLRDQGMEVRGRFGNMIAVAREGFTVSLEPKTTVAGLDHLVATLVFFVREGTDEEAVAAVARKLNDKTSGIQYSVVAGHLWCQIFVTFVDRLSLAEIEATFEFLQTSQFVALLAAPELMALLRS